MRSIFQVIFAAFILASCTGTTLNKRENDNSAAAGADAKKTTTPPSDAAKQPANIAGDLNLHGLMCDVTNANDPSAQATILGCTVTTESGDKFKGDVKDVTADLYVKNQDKPVSGQVTVLPKDQPYSFTVVIDKSKPSDAASLKVNASVDGKAEQWLVPLLLGYVHELISEADLYVNVAAKTTGPLCTKDAPCTSITKALTTLIPLAVSKRGTIHVAAGIYPESIAIPGKIVGNPDAQLIIVGEDESFKPTTTKFFELRPTGAFTGVAMSSVTDFMSDLTGKTKLVIQNAIINRGSTQTAGGASIAYGVYGRTADILLNNVQVLGAWDIAIGASFNTQLYLKGIKASGFTDTGIDSFNNAQIYLQSKIDLSGGSVGIRVEQQGQLFWYVDSDVDGATEINISFPTASDGETIGIYVLDAQVAESQQGGNKYTPAAITVANASHAIKVDHSKLVMNETNVKATNCKIHCMLATDHSTLRIQGLDSSTMITMDLAATSTTAGSIFAADQFSLIDIKDFSNLKMCNIQTSTTSPGRYITSSTITSTILTTISSTLPHTNYTACKDSALNRKVFVDKSSYVYAGPTGGTTLALDSVFLGP